MKEIVVLKLYSNKYVDITVVITDNQSNDEKNVERDGEEIIEAICCHDEYAGKIKIINQGMISKTKPVQNDFRYIENEHKKKKVKLLEEIEEELSNVEFMLQDDGKESNKEEKMTMSCLHKKVEKELNHEMCSTEFQIIITDQGE
jgi:hypothetical protein